MTDTIDKKQTDQAIRDILDKPTAEKTFDEMSINELVETNAILNDNNDAVAKQLRQHTIIMMLRTC